MKIGIVETASFGGLLHYAVQLGDALAERGHDVDLILPGGNELSDHAGPAQRRTVLTPPTRQFSEPPGDPLRLALRRARIGGRLLKTWTRILVETRRRNYDVVIINCDLQLSLSATAMLLVLACGRDRTRFVDVCHNVRTFNRWGGPGLFARMPLVSRLLRRLYRRFDLVLVHGEDAHAEFERIWPGATLAIIPHGDERLFAAQPPGPATEERILFFGTWSRVKGIPVLQEAFERVLELRPQARLTVAGAPHAQEIDVAALRAWARSQDGRVELVDAYVPIEQVPALFGSARVVALPYLTGYQSGVMALAMTLARPVVASDVGDFSSVVEDGATGLIVPPGDSCALAAALAELLADPERADRMGAAGRERVLGGSGWEFVAEQAESAIAATVSAAAV